MHRPPETLLTWLSLLRAHAAVTDALEATVEPQAGVPLAWLEVLHLLSLAPDGQMRMQELARSALLSRSGLTRLADRMERAGLLERAACPTDRRGTFARMTARGRALLEQGRPIVRAAVERHVTTHLTRDQELSLRTALETLVRANPSERVTAEPPQAAVPEIV